MLLRLLDNLTMPPTQYLFVNYLIHICLQYLYHTPDDQTPPRPPKARPVVVPKNIKIVHYL
jgi:hypothetical protein